MRKYITIIINTLGMFFVIYCYIIFNLKIENKITRLFKMIDFYHCSEMKSIKSNMECILDLDKRGD